MVRLLAPLVAAVFFAAPAMAERPNILWIVFEDISLNIGAYGDSYASTPVLDRLAEQSVLYARAFSNAGVCAPARSTLITGMYPPAIGTHHMRSNGIPPPEVRGFTELLRESGYYTSNHVKTDYNWKQPASTWDAISADWRKDGWRQRDGKPFFCVVNITDTHSSQIYHPWSGWPQRHEALPESQRHKPEGAAVPPYYPATGEVRGAYARYADNISYADRLVGEVLEQLEEDGLSDSTIVFFYSDHGAGMPRSKSFLFESSTHVPLLVRFPEEFAQWAPTEPGGQTDRIVSFVDFAPTALSLAGIGAPSRFHGTAFLGPHAGPPRSHVFGYRDRLDERYEFIRSVRGERFKYIRNYLPHLPWFHGQTRLYPSTHPVTVALHEGAARGLLDEPTALHMARRKPREQLFDLRADPHEINNLAEDAAYRAELERLRAAHRQWVLEHRDLGFLPESEMWLRYEGAAAKAFADDPSLYPLERILETADWVGLGKEFAGRQVRRLADTDATVRFWAAVGLRASGAATQSSQEALARALDDPSEAVRTVAAETLCHAGNCREPLRILAKQLDHSDEWVRLRAVNALHRLGDRTDRLRDRLEAFHRPFASLSPREFFRKAGYPHWVLRAFLGTGR